MLLPASSVCGLFKWRQFEPEVILMAVGWYLSLLGGITWFEDYRFIAESGK
jgi:transposase-like protein